ncbi:ABC-type multidrug transport system fused ATPase/permease subunit [Natronocella acetinitrilica]|uniref:ABC-type multidrug transport system fused ATPase/permease subunit n=1 Tax=Natronocella acetinitrilica TaxID=414046 RepID=A0AAE3G7B1_9GAMM|nr:ABC transporter ATP-binding protein [Natronocella acetinitrilica]MCP1677145.1 ABC-type multidrug transport system fused ATPase/permease subunit [Natronocella acetinitrilica]
MLSTLRSLNAILTRGERRRAALVFVVMLMTALLETAGVASVMPFIAVLSNPEVIQTNAVLRAAYEWSGAETTNGFLILLGVAVLLLLVFSLAFKAFSQWVQLTFSKMRVHALGCRLMERYLGQPYEWFLSRHSSRISTTILSEINKVISGSLFPALQLIAHSLIVLSLFAFLIYVDPLLALSIAGIISGAYIVLYLSVRRYLGRMGAIQLQSNRERFKVVNEAFSGIKDVKIAGLERPMLERFRPPSKRVVRVDIMGQIVREIPSLAMQALVFGGMMIVLLYLMTVHGSIQGALPIFATFAFAGYRLMPALQNIYRQLAMIRVTGASLESLVLDLRQLRPLESSLTEAEQARRKAPETEITLNDVTYAYPGTDRPALDHINLTIKANTTVGLVGSTGSGKTTTVDVLLGLLEPHSGALRIDGDAITPRNVRGWQRSIGYVPQTIYLSDDTVAGNIAFGIPPDEVIRDDVIRAAKIASLHDFVMSDLPQGFDTHIGERGVRLSGGQRQRIGIARALYHNPDVLILDEATSALDNVTERHVMEAVNKLGKQKTIIMIAHRLSTVRHCDRIYLLDQGRVQDFGTYDQLRASSELFQAMAASDT